MFFNDQRISKNRPWGYVVCQATNLFGYRIDGNGRALYALAVKSEDEAKVVLRNAKRRKNISYSGLVRDLNADGTPLVDMRSSDHVSVVDQGLAEDLYLEKKGVKRLTLA